MPPESAAASVDDNGLVKYDPDTLLRLARGFSTGPREARDHQAGYDAWCAANNLARASEEAEDGYLAFALEGIEADLDLAHEMLSGTKRVRDRFEFRAPGEPSETAPAPRAMPQKPPLTALNGSGSMRPEPQGRKSAGEAFEPANLMDAASSGDARAKFGLGISLIKDEATKEEVERGLDHIEDAAELGLLDARRFLGRLWEQGQGFPRNIGTALFYYRYAAIMGSRSAYDDLVRLRDRGEAAKRP